MAYKGDRYVEEERRGRWPLPPQPEGLGGRASPRGVARRRRIADS